jgi:hypothetical protein
LPAGRPSAHGWPDAGASIPQKAIGQAIDLERIAINHTGRLSEGGRDCEREGGSQGEQFHRLACNCGDRFRCPAFRGAVSWHLHGPEWRPSYANA